MMAYIWTLEKDGEGHFTEENRDLKAEKFDMCQEIKVVHLDRLYAWVSF